MTRSTRVVLVAEESAGLHALRLVIDSGVQLVAVFTSGSGKRGSEGIISLSAEAGVPSLGAARLQDEGPRLAALSDLLLNVHSLSVLRPEVLRGPRIGSFNVHPGPLPEYAGLSAPSWAIWRGEISHAVTVHWMDAVVDAGDIAYESRFPIASGETGLSLSLKCIRQGLSLLSRLLADAAAEPQGIPRIPQDLGRRHYYPRRPPEGTEIDWRQSAREIERFIRAADYQPFTSPWPVPFTTLGPVTVQVFRARATGEAASDAPGHILAQRGDGVVVATGDGALELLRVGVGGATGWAAGVLPPGQRLGRAESLRPHESRE